MTYDHANRHLGPARIQSFLDGDLSPRDRLDVEAHLTVCAQCASEVDGWTGLIRGLEALSSFAPHEGFQDLVMAQVRTGDPGSVTVSQRGSSDESVLHAHPTPDVLQDFVEGALTGSSAERVAAHLAGCADCSRESRTWLHLMGSLDRLPSLSPDKGFRERVLTDIPVRGRRSIAARLRERIVRITAGRSEHVPQRLLQELVDGRLSDRAIARVEAHVVRCVTCRTELRMWRSLVIELNGLQHFAPSAHFRHRLLHRLTTQERSTLQAAPTRAWHPLVAAARRRLPGHRRVLAALSGFAVTPVVIVGLMTYSAFSHSALTLEALGSYAWWRASALAAGSVAWLWRAMMAGPDSYAMSPLIEMFAGAPVVVSGGVLLYSSASVLAVRVLWKNLYAHGSTAP